MTNHEPATMPAWRPIVAAVMLAIGIGLVALSFAWSTIFNGNGGWSNEQAREYQAASQQLHSLSHEYSQRARQGNDSALHEELEKAKLEYDSLRSDLDAAIARPRRVEIALRTIGMALIGASGVLLYQSRSTPTA